MLGDFIAGKHCFFLPAFVGKRIITLNLRKKAVKKIARKQDRTADLQIAQVRLVHDGGYTQYETSVITN